eukprot:m.67692 g.67692  ORF g.67692 m.67692 type:complete len:231 (+) comp12725_c0_seq2:48-740(+)
MQSDFQSITSLHPKFLYSTTHTGIHPHRTPTPTRFPTPPLTHTTHRRPTVHVLETPSRDGLPALRRYLPKDHRTLALQAYFACPTPDVFLPPSQQSPLAVSTIDVPVRILHAQVAPSEHFAALNGVVVALGIASDPSEANLFPVIGHGLVRAVDPATSTLFIVTPVPPALLSEVTVILRGDIETPVEMLIQCSGAHEPYLTSDFSTSRIAGGGSRSTRTTLMRRKHQPKH